MARVFKVLLLWLVVGALVWLFTLWHWQQTAKNVDLFDIVANLLVLPTALVATWLLVLWGIKKVKAKAAAPVSSGLAPNLVALDGHSSDSQHGHGWILDASAMTRLGQDAQASWSEMRGDPTRPGLDRELQDFDGLPIFSARVNELEIDATDGDSGLSEAPISMVAQRAIALMGAPIDQLASTWADLIDEQLADMSFEPEPSTDRYDPNGKAYLAGVSHSSNRGAHTSARAIHCHIRLLMPADWPLSDQDAVVCAARAQMAELANKLETLSWPAIQWHVVPADSPEAWWSELDQTIQGWLREGSEEMWLLLSVDSALDDAAISHWQSVGQLFTAHHQTGRIPGEAAVGMLLLSPSVYSRLNAGQLEQPAVRMNRPVRLKRDKSADASGRVGGDVLAEAMNQSLAVAGIQPHQDLLIVADADHRGSRTSELFEAIQAVVPGLDPMTQVARAGEWLGEVGSARSLLSTALGCAALWSSEDQRAAVATHVQSSHDRVVLTLTLAGADSVASV